MTSLERHAHTGCLMFVFSDFRGFDADQAARLSRLRRHGDTVLVTLYDRLEQSLPTEGRYRFGDGVRDVILELSPRTAGQYRDRFEERLQRLRSFAQSNRMRFLLCSTEEDPLKILQRGMSSDRHHL
jgi:hypothetical protein